MGHSAYTPELSLVICTLDEAASIGRVIDEVREVLAPVAFEIIVVDDSVGPETADAVALAAGDDARVRVIRRHAPRGLASAAIHGWRAARGEILGLMDGDGQHDAERLPAMLEQVRQGRDFSIASRFAPSAELGLSGSRWALSHVGTLAVRLLVGARTSDPLSGFFLMKRDGFLQAAPKLTGVGFKILADLLTVAPSTPSVGEVPAVLRTRLGGRSKLDARVLIEAIAQLVEQRSAGVIKTRFMLFACVGATGLAVHAAALMLALGFADFGVAQACAITTAMISNFCLNNVLTFRDLRLRGSAFWRGLGAFMLACLGGAAINQLSATGLSTLGLPAIVAGLGGAVFASTWNYVSTSRIAWGREEKDEQRPILGRLGQARLP